jgi:glycosyltransferase involved in cell wall biosynthesis
MSATIECSPRASSLQPAGASDPLVVALLYNRNGMATWCWEAAHALHEMGRHVLLIAAGDIPLPGTPAVEVVRIDLAGRPGLPPGRIARIASSATSRLAAGPDGTLQQIHMHLAGRRVRPAAYILNQSTLVDRAVPCCQLVAAWSYPVHLPGYLRKVPLLVPGRGVRAFLRTVLSSVGWWRKDWRAYRAADRVLSVTKALDASLRRRSVPSDLAYPGTFVTLAQDRPTTGIRMLMAAARLNEPRKRILWMLDAMKEITPPPGTFLQLAGEPDDALRRAAAHIPFPVEFLGHVKRQQLQQIMRQAQVFCFGSLLDDWGYVLVEAMANGLVPVAPGLSPFNEILGGAGYCYRPQSRADFQRVLVAALSSPLMDKGREARHRAQALFSRQAFGRFLLQSVESVARRNRSQSGVSLPGAGAQLDE